MLKKDHRQFLLAWIRNPVKVGIMVPSSPALGRAMAANLDLSKDSYVVELGAGTGAVTEELLKAGLPPERLVIVELDTRLYHILQKKYPRSVIIQGNAANLSDLLEARGITNVGAVISSLPLLNMPGDLRARILEEAFEVLPEDGSFVQYTYGLNAPLSKQQIAQLGLTAKPTKRVWSNFPPARVWRFTAAEAA